MSRLLDLPADLQLLLAESTDLSLEARANAFLHHHRASLLKNEPAFQLSNRLKAVLDQLAVALIELDIREQRLRTDPQTLAIHTDSVLTSHLASTTLCEYLIFKINSSTPLEENAFLPYWVNLAAEIQHSPSSELTYSNVYRRARYRIACLALTAPGVEDGLKDGTQKLPPLHHSDFTMAAAGPLQHVDLSPYVTMLRAAGLKLHPILKTQYPASISHGDVEEVGRMRGQHTKGRNDSGEARPSPRHEHAGGAGQRQAEMEDVASDTKTLKDVECATTGKGKGVALPVLPLTARTSLREIGQALEADLEGTTHALIRLPLDLPSLEFLTRLLQDGHLSSKGVDVSYVVREYVQHALRVVERLGTTVSPLPESSQSSEWPNGTDGLPQGRDEQVRGVRLLIMFMKNLLRRGLLPLDELAFDLQEVCVRYLWIHEVREFRAFLEGGHMIGQESQRGREELSAGMNGVGG